MISRFFIDRPVLANVLAALIVVVGLIAALSLPVAQYPEIVPPTVQVTTSYPGASPRTLVNTVAIPIEEQINGVDHMLYMRSTSAADGSYTLTVTFRIGTDPAADTELVQNRVNTIIAALPAQVQSEGVSVQSRSSDILEIVTLGATQDRFSALGLTNYAVLHMQDQLARLPGVGGVRVFGSSPFAMRVWLDPGRMQAIGVSAQDAISAIQAQNLQVATGALGAPPMAGSAFQYPLTVNDNLADPASFGRIVVKAPGGTGAPVARLRDIARITLGAASYATDFRLNGHPAAGLAIFLTPGANALSVAHAVAGKLAELRKGFPPGLTASVPFDTTLFIRASIREVFLTLAGTGLLVLVVILLFVQDWRAMLVPATTVPVTIIGAFAAMAVLGFTINLQTLFALVLAIGIVVDDAIIVVEAASNYLQQGFGRREAAARAMDDLLGPIIGITLVLIAVFLPAAFIPGLTGRMYAQFALVIAATAVISAVNAVTLKPTQCAVWLRPPRPEAQRNALYRRFNAGYDRLEAGYGRLIGHLTARSALVCVIGLLLIGLGAAGLAWLPSGFIPVEDQGYFLVEVQLPSGASLSRTQAVMRGLGPLIGRVPGVASIISVAGVSPLDNNAPLSSAGLIYVILKPWEERGSANGLLPTYNRLQRIAGTTEAAKILVVPPPPIAGIGNANGLTLEAELRSGADYARLDGYARRILAALRQRPSIGQAFTTFSNDAPYLDATLDRDKAQAMQVSAQTVFSTLNSQVASGYIGQFLAFDHLYQVIVQGDDAARAGRDALGQIQVATAAGGFVPLGSLLSFRAAVAPPLITRYNLYPAATIIASTARGFSSGQALHDAAVIATDEARPGTGFEWTAMSFQELAAGKTVYLVFALSLLLVYLTLAGLYESWIGPIPVLLAVPLTLLGPVAALSAFGAASNLYSQIGFVLLIALSAKNAILVVEFARNERQAGHTIIEAALAGARRRFRPILMTSIAFILGVLPLVLASGAGANARKSIGIVAFSGMLASTLLAVVFVPSFYVIAQRLEERGQRRVKEGQGTLSPETPAKGEALRTR